MIVQNRMKLMPIKRKKTNARTKRVAWTKEHVRDLKAHSKSKTPVTKISKAMTHVGRYPSKGAELGNRHRPSSIASLRAAGHYEIGSADDDLEDARKQQHSRVRVPNHSAMGSRYAAPWAEIATRGIDVREYRLTFGRLTGTLGASISSLIPAVSCRRCSPNAPFARLEMLTAERP
jgi:hypothetical protein